jgi:hypothetical protein
MLHIIYYKLILRNHDNQLWFDRKKLRLWLKLIYKLIHIIEKSANKNGYIL